MADRFENAAGSTDVGSVEDRAKAGLEPGLYRHYKGGEYAVEGVATHSETQELLVVYRPLYGERGLWVRPLAMFVETVLQEGDSVPRFAYIGPIAKN